ncbi:DUF1688 family protein [Ramlibacter sp.]|uniref:DUF1688 family protein n=2 Tax=Ramlibacter aquaticus TaxID=2780094 RepID=A0ABR9SAF5_9BURK|nr:DUF1688 family protein [Ramlibacter sp.]MBE7939318.1 DUF1688 family protein [Ramlibacter aquaticus]
MGSSFSGSQEAAAEAAASVLRSTPAIRERAGQLLRRARAGDSRWFTVDDGQAAATADLVVSCVRGRQPPLHSIWRAVEAGGMNRRGHLDALMGGLPIASKTHALVDFTAVAVFLGGMAARGWRYTEAASGRAFEGEQGLAVATLHAFAGGLFSGDPQHPLQADSTGLRALLPAHLAAAFQVTEANALPGLGERATLLRRLGEVMAEQPEVFGDAGRPGGLFDMIVTPFGHGVPHTADVAAHDILSQVLVSLSQLWPAGNTLGELALGDCWRHEAVRGEGASDGWMPLHERAQWLSYSLLEPFEWAGVKVRDVDLLTALPDPATCGLLLDTGWLRLRDPDMAQEHWRPRDEIVVEWRALAVALMDELGSTLRERLRLDATHQPLARLLGSAQAAGRAQAERLRAGRPPLLVQWP